MPSKFNIEKLNFGSDDAERDAKDGFLSKVFLKTSLYSRLSNGKRELIIGRKGAGKSALCLTLKSTFEGDDRSTILATPKSLSVQKIQQLKVDSVSKEEAYVLSWKYVLLVKIGIEVLSVAKRLKLKVQGKSKKLLGEVDFFLTANNEIKKSIWNKDIRLLNPVSGLSKFSAKLGVFEAGFEASPKKELVDAANILEEFEDKLEELLSLLDQISITVLIDKIDEVWNTTEESSLMIIGLINAIHGLNSSLQRTNILLFLRSDIYDTLRFNDADKLRNLEERIFWSDKDLKQLIANRGRFSAGLDIKEADKLWNIFFDNSIGEQDSFRYILNRTLKRPRELIQFCNLSLTIAQDQGYEKITHESILSAEAQYSNWKLNDLVSEFLVQYPYLKDVLVVFQGFRPQFTRDEFNLHYQEAQKQLTRLYSELHSLSSSSVLQILFTIGFLGAKIYGNEIYFYDDPKLILPQCEFIVVHPAFHVALGIRAYTVTFDSGRSISIGGDFNSSIIVAGDVAVGGSVNQFNIGSTVNLGDVSGSVTNSISQLSNTSTSAPELKELLLQLQSVIETNESLSSEDKVDALEQIIALAEAAQNPNEPRAQRTAKTASKILKGIVASLSESSDLVASTEKLLPLIVKLLGI